MNRIVFGGLAALAAALLVYGCGGGGGGGGGGVVAGAAVSTQSLSVSTNGSVNQLPCPAGQTTNLQFISEFPAEGPFVGAKLDVAATFALGTIEPGLMVGDIPVAGNIHVEVRIGALDLADTCNGGYLIQAFDIPTPGGQPVVQDTEADEQTLNLLNSGQYQLCVQITPNVPVRLTLPSVEFDVESCQSAPLDMNGEWSGPYTCTNSCGEGFGDVATIYIEQDGHSARYFDDGGGVFSGTVCGNEFHFSGGYGCDESLTCNEVETGLFTKLGATSGRKQSHWRSVVCEGDCQDSLARSNGRFSGAYDVDFKTADWMVQKSELDGADSLVAASESGAYHKVTLDALVNGSGEVYLRSLQRSYDPKTQGPIGSVDFRWTAKNFTDESGDAFVYPVIYQAKSDGTIQIFETEVLYFSPAAWSEQEFQPGTPPMFISVDEGTQPNFGSTGGRIWFGYKLLLINSIDGSVQLRHALDNFSVIVNRST